MAVNDGASRWLSALAYTGYVGVSVLAVCVAIVVDTARLGEPSESSRDVHASAIQLSPTDTDRVDGKYTGRPGAGEAQGGRREVQDSTRDDQRNGRGLGEHRRHRKGPRRTLRRSMSALISYYCRCAICCGWDKGITFSGTRAEVGVTAACERALLGRWVFVVGVGVRLCEDTGSAIGSGRIDIFMESHQKALDLGVIRTTFWVIG